MPALSGTGLPRSLEILEAVRVWMNDPAINPQDGTAQDPAVWTNYVLLPHLNGAYRRLQRDLAGHGLKFMAVDSDPIILLPTDDSLTDLPNGTDTDHLLYQGDGVTPLVPGQATNSALPVDYVALVKAWEKGAGSTENYIALKPAHNGLPQRRPELHLEYYEILADGLQFIGATQPIQMLLRYQRSLPVLTADEDSQALIRDSLDCLAALTVAKAARSRGVTTLVADALGQYESERELLIANYFRPQQSQPARRRPYGARRRALYQ